MSCGLWRRCSLASYKSASPEWEDVLDLDALNAEEKIPEGSQYVWHGYDVLDEGLVVVVVCRSHDALHVARLWRGLCDMQQRQWCHVGRRHRDAPR